MWPSAVWVKQLAHLSNHTQNNHIKLSTLNMVDVFSGWAPCLHYRQDGPTELISSHQKLAVKLNTGLLYLLVLLHAEHCFHRIGLQLTEQGR